jgi:hypothetical protein
VPEITPVVRAIDNPAGRPLALNVHELGSAPHAETASETELPSTEVGGTTLAIVNGCPVCEIVQSMTRLAAPPWPSTAVTVTAY